ncbi:MAG: glycosyltransferase family A protein [Bacteroidales bacterium]|nr:glycosyltransferase family A protein [Bacteroidales bacterium]
MISVVMPLYNKEAFVQRALLSIRSQSLQPDEVIVVDDGSEDGSLQRVEELHYAPVRVITQSNQGVSSARNRGLADAKGTFVAFLDADDTWEPCFLETMLSLSRAYPMCDVFSCAYCCVDSLGQVRDIDLHNLLFAGMEGIMENYFVVASHSHPPLCSSNLMIQKRLLLDIGGFPIGIGQGEDLLTWARLATRSNIAYSRRVLSSFFTGIDGNMGFPKRIPPLNDVVGRALSTLYYENPSIPGLKEYVAHWHKMRASIFLRLRGYEKQCRSEIDLALQWDPSKRHLFAYSLLLLLPYAMRMNLLRKI